MAKEDKVRGDVSGRLIHETKKITTGTVDKAKELKREVQKNIITAVSAALAFIIALTWRDAINDGVDQVLETLDITQDIYLYKFTVAFIVTIICVIGIIVVSNLSKK